jgi:hypothetical protein
MANNLAVLPAKMQRKTPALNVSESFGTYSETLLKAEAAAALDLISPNSPQRIAYTTRSDESLKEKLFEARAACKIRTASVAMHLDPDWRRKLFAQIDNLLSLEEWDEQDRPIVGASFATFLRMVLLIKAKRRPGLGAAANGNVIAAWTVGRDRLTIECLANDEVRWVLVHYPNDERESGAGQTTLPRLLDVLNPYNPERWFADERPKAPV